MTGRTVKSHILVLMAKDSFQHIWQVATRVMVVVLILCIEGCEKKPLGTTPKRKKSASAESTSQPQTTQEALPDATRPSTADLSAPLEFPSNLPTNTDIPKPNFPGAERPIQAKLIEAYCGAVRAPSDATKSAELGMLFFALDAPTEAEKCFARAASLEPTAFRWQYYRSLALELAFDIAGAARMLEAALSLPGDHAEGTLKLADYRRPTDGNAARALYLKFQSLAPNDPRADYGLALCDIAEKKHEDARRRLLKAVAISPTYKEALSELAKICDLVGDRKGAQMYGALAESGGVSPIGTDPDAILLKTTLASPDVVSEIANRLQQNRQIPIAIDVLKRAVSLHPEAWNLRYQLSLLYAIDRQYDAATAELRVVLENAPDQPGVRKNLVQMLTDSKQYAAADNVFKTLISLRKDDVELAIRYAEFLLASGWPKDAFEVLQGAETTQTTARATELLRIEALVGQGKGDLAAQRFQALRKFVKPPGILAESLSVDFIAMIATQHEPDPSGFKRAALKPVLINTFAEALQRHSMADDANVVRSGLATVARITVALAQRGNFDQSLRLIQRTAPADAGGRIRDAFVRVFTRMREADRASADAALKSSLKRMNDSLAMSNVLAWLLATSPDDKLRDGRLAYEIATRCCQATNHEEPEYLDTLAAAQSEIGQFNEAVATMRQALELAKRKDSVEAVVAFEARLGNYLNKSPYRVSE